MKTNETCTNWNNQMRFHSTTSNVLELSMQQRGTLHQAIPMLQLLRRKYRKGCMLGILLNIGIHLL